MSVLRGYENSLEHTHTVLDLFMLLLLIVIHSTALKERLYSFFRFLFQALRQSVYTRAVCPFYLHTQGVTQTDDRLRL